MSLSSFFDNYGHVWLLPGPNLPQEYMSNTGCFRLMFCDGQARAILVTRLITNYHPLIDWKENTTIELHSRHCRAPFIYAEKNILFRLLNCRHRRAWLKYPVAWQPEQRAVLNVYLEVWTAQYEIFRPTIEEVE